MKNYVSWIPFAPQGPSHRLEGLTFHFRERAVGDTIPYAGIA